MNAHTKIKEPTEIKGKHTQQQHEGEPVRSLGTHIRSFSIWYLSGVQLLLNHCSCLLTSSDESGNDISGVSGDGCCLDGEACNCEEQEQELNLG